MPVFSKSFLPAVDFTLSHLPKSVRQRVADRKLLLTDLLMHGGRDGFLEYARALGFRGKWTRDEPDRAERSPAVARALGEMWLNMKEQQRTVASPYLPAQCWSSTLDAEWAEPRRWLEAGDWATFETFLRNFFRNGGVSGLWGGRDMFDVFVNQSGWRDLERLAMFMRQLEAWRREVPGGSIDDLDEARVGNPWGYDIDERVIVEPAFEYHTLALRIRDLVAGVARPVVLEIGGGYGGLARQILRQIPGVLYLGLDVPENVIIQSWYLTRSLPNHRISNDSLDRAHQSLPKVDAVILSNWALADLRLPRLDVVLNVHSFSEMEYSTLEAYFTEIVRLRPEWIFHENLSSPRRDSFYGIPATNYPPLQGYRLIASCEARWPRYDHRSSYPCREYLFRINERILGSDARGDHERK